MSESGSVGSPSYSSRSTADTDANDDAVVPHEASAGGSLQDPVSEAEMDALASQMLEWQG